MRKLTWWIWQVTLLAMVLGLQYLLASFVEWSLHPDLWHITTRIILVVLWLCVLVFAWVGLFWPSDSSDFAITTTPIFGRPKSQDDIA